MHDNNTLRQKVREAIQSGRLPSRRPERKLYPGDYNRAEPGTADRRVWSETGCTCVLTTSPRDILR